MNYKVRMTTNKVIGLYLIVYLFITLFYNICNHIPATLGEWDDYCLPTISIINEQNFSISSSDVAKAKEIYADWSETLNGYQLSPYQTRNGGEMSWYFPTYSAACVPYTLLLYKLHLPAVYAFPLTNISVIMLMAISIWKYMNCSSRRRLALIVLLTANPIAFYYSWASAEPFIFALTGISLVFWHNKWWKRAAFCLSIAGTLNPTLMIIGIAMVIDYFVTILRNTDNGSTVWTRFTNTWPSSLYLGCCFVPSIIPMIYNYYNIGAINLTAAYLGVSFQSYDTVFSRFTAYLFDLNFGMLPYYSIIFMMAIILIPFAFIKKQWQYLLCILTGIGIIASYSLMFHINCGISGISRYNAWGAIIFIFAVISYADKIFTSKKSKKTIAVLLAASSIMASIIVLAYGPVYACRTSFLSMTPIAKWVLNNAPQLYNPLHSTFASRIQHIDGAYDYKTPIFYVNKEILIKKMLVSPKDKDFILSSCVGDNKSNQWLTDKMNNLSEETYLSIPSDIHLELKSSHDLEMGKTIYFYGKNYNANLFFISGISSKDSNFSWTEGHESICRTRIAGAAGRKITGTLNIHGVFNGKQRLKILVNNQEVINTEISQADTISFTFTPDSDFIDFRMELPDAISPYKLKQSYDYRQLALQVVDLTFNANN